MTTKPIEKTQATVIFEALKNMPDGEYTTREIMNSLNPDDFHRFKGNTVNVSKALQRLEAGGSVKRVDSVVIDGMINLVWKVVGDKPLAKYTIEKNEPTDEIPTSEFLDNSLPEPTEAETDPVEIESKIDSAEPLRIYNTEAEREYYDGFDYPSDGSYSIEEMIQDKKLEAISRVADVFYELKQLIPPAKQANSVDDALIDSMIDGLFEISGLLNEKIATKTITPVIDFLRGLKSANVY